MRRPLLLTGAIAIAMTVILGGQAVSDTIVADQTATTTGAALERAGFAYLTGIRTFAAAVLWNRLDPVYHEYYSELPFAQQTQMLPTIRMVTALSPEFVDAYDVGAWVLFRRDMVDESLELAADGVAHNPESGVLRINYAQLLWLSGTDLDEAVRQAEVAAGNDVQWRDLLEQHDHLAIAGAIFKDAGLENRTQQIHETIEELDEAIGDRLPAGSHDHDGDGVPDH